MATCDVCGNEYDKAFQVIRGEESRTFDSFECAIHAMAPACEHCDCRVIGHGVEAEGRIFCCAHCAQESGVTAATDRVG
jgi:Prokaryotic metallothionein